LILPFLQHFFRVMASNSLIKIVISGPWKVKLSALKGELSGVALPLYCTPFDPALKGGDCGVLSVQRKHE